MKKHSSKINNNGEIIASNGITIGGDIHFHSESNKANEYFRLFQLILLITSSLCTIFMGVSFIDNGIDKLRIALSAVTLSLAFFAIACTSKFIHHISMGYIILFGAYLIHSVTKIRNGFFILLNAYFSKANLPNSHILVYLDGIKAKDYGPCSTLFFMSLVLIITFLLFIACVVKINFPIMFLASFPIFELGVYWGWRPNILTATGLVCCWIITLSLQTINHNSNKAGRQHTFIAHRRKKTFYLTSNKVKRRFFYKLAIFSSLLCVGIFSFVIIFSKATGFVRPKAFKEIRHNISEAVKNFSMEQFIDDLSDMNPFSNKASGGLNGGKLGKIDEIEFNGSTALKITVPEFDGSLYLKGYTAGKYDDNRWVTNDKSNYAESLKFIFSKKDMYVQDYNYYTTKQVYIGEPQSITVTVVDANPKYVYAPYMSLYSSDGNKGKNKMVPENETFVNLRSKKYALYYYNITSFEQNLSDWVNNLKGFDIEAIYDGERFSLMDNYEQYVFKNYTQIPKSEALDKATQIIENKVPLEINSVDTHDINDFMLIKKAISDYLGANYRYSLSPGKTPSSKDFIDYFLDEQSKGYCTHFASAGTMLMREFGFPARYVEGYRVDSSNLDKPDKDGNYDITVKDNCAHAWTEVFIKEVGWIPCDFTPGSSEDLSSQTAEGKDSSKGKESSTETVSSFGDSSLSENSSGQGSYTSQNILNSGSDNSNYGIAGSIPNTKIDDGNFLINVIKFILSCLAVVIIISLIVVIFILRRKRRIRKFNRSINLPDKDQCVKNAYNCCIKYLKLISIYSNANITDKQFSQLVTEQCKDKNISGIENEFAYLTELAIKAHMSGEHITADECSQARQALNKIRNNIYENQLNRQQRFSAKWFKNLY